MAKRRGVNVIGVVRGNADEGSKRSLADHVLSINQPDFPDVLSSIAGGRPITALLDSVGGPNTPKLFPALAPGARIIAYGVQDREPAAVTNAMLIYSNLTWKGFGIDRWLSEFPADRIGPDGPGAMVNGPGQDIDTACRVETQPRPVSRCARRRCSFGPNGQGSSRVR